MQLAGGVARTQRAGVAGEHFAGDRSLSAYEVNFDGIVGPTHGYAGLSFGNVASQSHAGETSNPKAAALEGLRKMKFLMDLGLKQAVLPPHERPDIAALRAMGFDGSSNADVLEAAFKKDPQRLADCCSASAMWAANAATVSPSADCEDRRVHITVANLESMFHRSLEAATTKAILSRIFADEECCVIHEAITGAADEGAANHTRLCDQYDRKGLEIFVYGRDGSRDDAPSPLEYPARHDLQASRRISESHRLDPDATMFVQQNPEAIDAGVFHNDVIAVGNGSALFVHEDAFIDQASLLDRIRFRFESFFDAPLYIIQVGASELSLADAVSSYLFNSQLVTLPDGTMSLVYPTECDELGAARAVIDRVIAEENPIASAHTVDVRQSMCNGGGPACLRLRIVLTGAELLRTHQGVFMTPELYEQLVPWVERHYRDALAPDDLRDVKLLEESRRALDELTGLLELGSVYSFQA